ncbi:hypothetical protein F6J84_03310 [Microbacterium caowuchunii]|uniref:hypothetical protein n=1 Tax=Microbacterium caowuchunii TaxID=2614638 RepID=UPI001244B8E2|nr:hypothetical protein [Microbacterium caowuchunii]QEV99242.1 hypothetical protein F6J84_03310 [Microbacterium caowuchunii]
MHGGEYSGATGTTPDADVEEVADAPGPGAPETPVLLWEFPPPKRSRRRLWIALSVVAGVLVLAAAAAGTTWAFVQAHERAMAERAVTALQQAAVEAELARLADVAQRSDAQRAAYRETLDVWNAEQEQAAQWRAGSTAPEPAQANPGGGAMPGEDPAGRAFLDSIGAPQVQLIIDAGAENCGFQVGAADPRTSVVGGCFNTRYPNWVFLAWEPGTEEAVWAIFVHEVMHWYQYQTYYPAFLAADRLGIPDRDYAPELEADASCRAVYVHGIPSWRYARTSAPCWVDGWYDGWLLDHLGSLGVPLAPPVSEDYEVVPVVRP